MGVIERGVKNTLNNVKKELKHVEKELKRVGFDFPVAVGAVRRLRSLILQSAMLTSGVS